MSDQVNEESGLLHPNTVDESPRGYRYLSWGKIATVAASLSVLGVFAVYQKSFLPANKFSSKRLQLAKSGAIKFSSLSSNERSDLFEDYKTSFKKEYSTKKEEKERYSYFLENLDEADKRNEKEKKAGGSAVHGLTVFSDISKKEFKEKYLSGYVPASDKVKADRKKATVKKYTGTDSNVDWTGVYTTDVNNQGYCGGCWAFSATEQIESDSIRQGLLTTSDALSAQQIISCDNTQSGTPSLFSNYGCSGGSTETAYYYVKYAGGLTTKADYPYASYYGSTGDCNTSKTNYVVTVDGYYALDGEDEMKDHVMSTGPLSVCLDATDWQTYQSGVLSDCSTAPNHCVQLVGINSDDNYWILRNSWGTSWGLSGYIWLEYGQDACAITTDPTYTSPTLVSR